MVGGHLQRTGYRHGVLAVAALSALVAAMYTHSSFTYPLPETSYSSSPILSGAYIKPHRFAIAIIVLNAISCALTVLMSVAIDWHFAIRTPAYVEFSWVGLAWCAELISVILAGIAAPNRDVCSLDKTSLGAYGGLVLMGKRLCSNWTAVFVTSMMSLILFTFHLTWHIVFRLWHRAALARRPTSPIDLWSTPIPKYYPISPHETQKKDDRGFLAVDERGTKPESSIVMDTYSLMFNPAAARNAERVAKEGTREHQIPVVNVIAPMEDHGTTDVSAHITKTTPYYPPGLETETKEQQLRPSSD
ncbi:unnamed protein product [Rhizoctonia solani]|uniref:Uncharacterized protein n=1 Tax=Rhizoctonia solani TaxID=456999 RepID=A0A8H3BSC7_9AGAM|nr:unnamed protein product [Rhizoctonia solani]